MGTEVEGPAYLLRAGDVAFCEGWDCQVDDDGLEERPRDGLVAGGVGGVAVERGCDGVGSGALGGESVFEGGDVGENGTVELGVDAGDELRPRFRGGKAASGAVEGDDVCSCIADGFGGTEIWRDVDVAVCVVGLDDADDGELREVAEGSDARNAFGAETTCSSA